MIPSIAELKNETCALLFTTYSELIRGHVEKLKAWLGNNFDGCIVFDESHKAKNFSKESGTKTGMTVHQLQEDFPLARIVYSSATTVSSFSNLEYLSRMGLWGEFTSAKV